MKRTIDIMTAARAKGVELPGEWWMTSRSIDRRQVCLGACTYRFNDVAACERAWDYNEKENAHA